jgi:E3 ubiquitin-protein ligase synoviolin
MMLLMFYGLPIHIMRDLFMTTRDFLKRLNALLRYRRAIQEMNKYADATVQDLEQENTCIICREEMRFWDPVENVGVVDRIRPKKLPCGHILHLGCLRSWLERQQVCPTCRSPVTGEQQRPRNGRRQAGLRIQFGQAPQQGDNQRGNENNNGNNDNHVHGDGQNANLPQGGRPGGQPRVFTLGPIRVGFGANDQQVRQLAQQFGMPQIAGGQEPNAAATTSQNQSQLPPSGDSLQQVGNLLQQAEQMLQRELQSLQNTQHELQIANMLNTEIQRLRQRRLQPQDAAQNGLNQYPTPYYPPTGAPIGLPPLPMQVPHLGGLSPFPPPFPGAPPRMNSPLMTRHGAGPSTTAIPAGSPELPDGLVLPPGWSLTPLQRLDNAQTAPPFPPQTTSVPHTGDLANGSQAASISVQPTPTVPHSQETAPAESSPFSAPLSSAARTRAEQAPTSVSSSDHPPVVSPSPMLPNWGGSNQLFGSGSRLDQGDTASQASTQAAPQTEVENVPEGSTNNTAHESTPETDLRREPSILELEQSEAAHTEEEPADKGKGRAVTVEEADDEDN